MGGTPHILVLCRRDLPHSRDLVEIVPVFYLTVPIFGGRALSLNQNILHLYVVFVAFAGIGMITLPSVWAFTPLLVSPKKAQREPLEAPLSVLELCLDCS